MNWRPIRGFLFGLAALILSSCGGTGNSTAPAGGTDSSEVARMKEHFADLVDDERETVLIAPADRDPDAYEITPASFDTVIVRAEPHPTDGRKAVDVLLKGSFPDGCTELHKMTQHSTADGRTVELTMRRPEGAMCTQVVRPYRYFFVLDGTFAAGQYTLTVNERPFHFTVE